MKKKQKLVGKIYLTEFLSGAIFYVIGMFLVTPPTKNLLIKFIGIGGLIAILASILIYTLISKSEKMDERAKDNLNKASSITLRIIFLLLLILGLGFQFLPITFTFSFGLVSFILAAILCIHAYAFFTLEMSGN